MTQLLKLTDNFGRVLREEWVEYGDPDPAWYVEARRNIREAKKERRSYGNPWGSPMRRGEGWHKRGYRDAYNNLTVTCSFSPPHGGSHTLEFTETATAKHITRQAVMMQTGGDLPRDLQCVCFHKKRELPVDGTRTAADYRIESGEIIYLKCYDERGNQLRWYSWNLCKPSHFIDDDGFEVLDEAFGTQLQDIACAEDVPASLARAAGVSKGVIAEWFAWRRATTGEGDQGEGDVGRVARAQAAQAHAVRAARVAQEALAARRSRELLVEGEIVEIAPDLPGACWCALRPRVGRPSDVYPPHGSFPVPGHGLLDTGNAAITMINPQTAAAAGIAPNPGLAVQIRGVNGVSEYPTATVRIRIRGVERRVTAAIGGAQGVLVGEDTLAPMFESGWAVAGFYGVGVGPGRVQWVRAAAEAPPATPLTTFLPRSLSHMPLASGW